jgi:hypothetical protein
VEPFAYQALLNALRAGTLDSFDLVPRGGPGQLAGPLSPLMFQMEGKDSPGARSTIVPPSVASAGGAAEMVEVYWEAYLRDVPFVDYGSNPLVALAVADMNKLSAYGGPVSVGHAGHPTRARGQTVNERGEQHCCERLVPAR